MGKHKAQHPPGVQARLERGQTLAQADAQLQSKLGDPDQLAKDVELIDNTTFAQFDRTEDDNRYNGPAPV